MDPSAKAASNYQSRTPPQRPTMQQQLSRAGQQACQTRNVSVAAVRMGCVTRTAGSRVAPVAHLASRAQQQQILCRVMADASRNTNFNSVDFEQLLPNDMEECPHGKPELSSTHQLVQGLVGLFARSRPGRGSPLRPTCLVVGVAGSVEGEYLPTAATCAVLAIGTDLDACAVQLPTNCLA